jgi:hypothetical protein
MGEQAEQMNEIIDEIADTSIEVLYADCRPSPFEQFLAERHGYPLATRQAYRITKTTH